MAKWEMQKRQEWIENRTEPFRRADLMEAFRVNIATASTDIKKYQKNTGALTYNLSNKRYVRLREE